MSDAVARMVEVRAFITGLQQILIKLIPVFVFIVDAVMAAYVVWQPDVLRIVTIAVFLVYSLFFVRKGGVTGE